MVENFHVVFHEQFYNTKNEYCNQIPFNTRDSEIIDTEIQKLMVLGLLVKAVYEPGQFVSPIFIRRKMNGELRMILNLKK